MRCGNCYTRRMATVHIIGAGISGLAAATALAADHISVKLYEATARAGGRCGSHAQNGAYIISPHDREYWRFIARINAETHYAKIRLPALPRASFMDYCALARSLLAANNALLTDYITPENPLYSRLLRRMARLVMHTPAHEIPARLTRRMLRTRTMLLPMVALKEQVIHPALHTLEYCGGSTYFNHALQGLEQTPEHIHTLHFARKKIPLAANDRIILATPPQVTANFFPQLTLPTAQHSSITLHYMIPQITTDALEWVDDPLIDSIRYRPGSATLTIRVADGAWHRDAQHLAEYGWRVLQVRHHAWHEDALPKWSILREKYAGHRMDVQSLQRLTVPMHPHPQCVLAGDWLDPAQPASLETAAASGHRAAEYTKALLKHAAQEQRRQ